MILFKKANELSNYLDKQRKTGMKTGFVPTMGALHQGHISLIEQAKSANSLCIASIFVNPTQFNDPADFSKYPVTIENDILLLEKAGCDLLFLPSVAEVYPTGTANPPNYELGYIETILDGKFRPGHFQGVCMVVHRLLSIVNPDNLYLGQKDYQQCMVINRLLELTGMKSIQLNISPTLRETDGLAMSSRNLRLTSQDRAVAPAIFETLMAVKTGIKPGSLLEIKKMATEKLTQKGFRVDYIEIATAKELILLNEWNGHDKLVALAAAFLGDVRLIDNMLLNPELPSGS